MSPSPDWLIFIPLSKPKVAVVTKNVRSMQMAESKFQEITFSDSDIVNPDDFIPAGEYNRRKVRPWLIHDHGFVVCVVFADCEQDALDIAVDEGKLDRYQITEEDAEDYPTLNSEEEAGICRLGNASEPFNIESLGMIELPNPKFSFCSLFNESVG
jgi:hypothetical protein